MFALQPSPKHRRVAQIPGSLRRCKLTTFNRIAVLVLTLLASPSSLGTDSPQQARGNSPSSGDKGTSSSGLSENETQRPQPPTRQPDLCRHAEIVVVGQVETVDVVTAMVNGRSRVMSEVAFRVRRSLVGDVKAGEVIPLQTAGGVVGSRRYGASGYPQMEENDWFVLFLSILPQLQYPVFLSFNELPPEVAERLPDEGVLSSVLSATCGANPDGIHRGRPFHLVLPDGILLGDLPVIFGLTEQ